MIHPKAVKEFLARERDDWSWMKRLSHVKLDRELERLGFRTCNAKPLLKHQKVCVLLGIMFRAFPFWLDMGTGKTRIALELLNYWKEQGELTTAIVLAPSESALIGWENQIKLWQIPLPFVTLLNSPSQEKRDAIDEFEEGIVLATYPGLTRALSVLVPGKKGKKKRLKANQKLIDSVAKRIQAIVPDEATKLGRHDSLTFKVVEKLRKTTPIFYELAGRPFGRDPTMLWSQLKLVDGGETLGDTLGLFRAAFFREEKNYWGGFDYEFKKSMKRDLRRIIQHRSITYRWDECIDLPPLVPNVEEVSLPAEPESYYEQFAKQFLRRNSSYAERRNAFIRMRQVSSGFVGFTDDETGKRAEVAFDENPKLDRLLELVEQLPRGCKFVIFYEFTWSGHRIHEALEKMGVRHAWSWGGSGDPRKIQDEFDHDERVRGMLANHRKGAYANNWQRANYLWFYESPVPVIDREQAERRVRRQGQARTVFQSDLVCRGTVDARILAFHREGEDLDRAIRGNPEAVLGRKSPRN